MLKPNTPPTPTANDDTPEGWTQTTLGEIASFSTKKTKEFSVKNYISTENMLPNKQGITKASDLPSTGDAVKFNNGDILISNIRPYFKKIWQASFNGACSNDVLVLTTYENKKYLYYLLSQDCFFDYVMLGSKGVKMPRGDKDHIKQFPLLLPPLPEQEAIAKVLGVLDDKIELNRRMNETLEGMAEALFKSWFVDFDPVHRNIARREGVVQDDEAFTAFDHLFPDAFEDSPLGLIPSGWSVGTVGDACICHDSKRIPLSKMQREQKKGTIPYYGATSIMDFVNEDLFNGIFLLIGEDGSVAKEDGTPFLQYIWGKCWVNNHAHVLEGANSISTEFLYLFMRQTNITPYITGAVQLKLNQGNLMRIPLILPPKEINSAFTGVLNPIFSKIRFLFIQSQTLAELREALLPRLMSGRLRVASSQGGAL